MSQNAFIVGEQYLTTQTHGDYCKKGSVIIYTADNRWLVRWEDTNCERYQLGCEALRGYDPVERRYRLALSTDGIVTYPVEYDQERFDKIAELIREHNTIGPADWKWFEAHGGEVEEDYVYTVDAKVYEHRDSAFHCPVSDDYYSSDHRFVTAWDRHGNEILAHERSLSESGQYFWCDGIGAWYSRRGYSRVYVADLDEYWCLDANECDLHYSEEDEQYYRDPDNMPENQGTRIPSYHSEYRNWVVPEGITLGVELEVFIHDPITAYENRPSNIIGERDGSLDRHYGVEFIGPPMLYTQYNPNGAWAKMLEAIKDAGCPDEQGDGYGMHISVGRAYVLTDVQARFVLFLNNCQSFSEFIAGRTQNRWAEYDKKDIDFVNSAFASCGGGEWGGKYSATHVDCHRIEVRIFKATTDDAMFQKNIDYVHSALMFASEHDDVADVVNLEKYLSWLSKTDGYEALKAFIGDKGKDFVEHDSRKALLIATGFIIEESDNDSII